MPEFAIRPYRPTDRAALLDFVAALQDFERTLHDSRRPGSDMAAPYLAHLEEKVTTCSGRILVAELDERPTGFVCCWVESEDNDLALSDDAKCYGYISDVYVVAAYRGCGLGERLLTAAESFLVGWGVKRLLIGSLAVNTVARALYHRQDFRPYEVVYEKMLA